MFYHVLHHFTTIIEDDLLVEKAVLGQAERLGIQAQWQLRRLGSEGVLAPEEPKRDVTDAENVGKTWGKRVIYRGKVGENGEKGKEMMQKHRISCGKLVIDQWMFTMESTWRSQPMPKGAIKV
jgi:hypothetical protein